MGWIKIPAEHHPIFFAALPRDPRVTTKRMFGGVAAFVNGYMIAGLFARSAVVRLAPEHFAEALELDGAAPFDPMGNGRVMRESVLLPDSVMDEPSELTRWFSRAIAHGATLPPKVAKGKKAVNAASAAKPTKDTARAPKPAAPKRAAAKKAVPKKAVVKKPAPKKTAPKKAAAKKAAPKKAAAKKAAPKQPVPTKRPAKRGIEGATPRRPR